MLFRPSSWLSVACSHAGSRLTTFWITVALVIPFCLTTARLFAPCSQQFRRVAACDLRG
jgi:hypothetical protein